jgi:N-hydroxyarylamine O-acetyltransferase
LNDRSRRRLAAYLERIGHVGAVGSDAAALDALQRAHRLAIPFENLDVRLGREIRIDSESVFDKLVSRPRGGYCFEQNRLFADMLAALGLATRPLLARVRLGPPAAEPPPRTHVLLLADIGGEAWLADVGFGGSYVPAMPLREGHVALTDDGARHRLRRTGKCGSLAGEWLLERSGPYADTDRRALPHTDWQPQYSFDLAQVAPADLEQANHWTATAASSRFTNLHIATIALPAGFASLIERTLNISGVSSEEIGDAAAYRDALASRFGIRLGNADAAALPLFRA